MRSEKLCHNLISCIKEWICKVVTANLDIHVYIAARRYLVHCQEFAISKTARSRVFARRFTDREICIIASIIMIIIIITHRKGRDKVADLRKLHYNEAYWWLLEVEQTTQVETHFWFLRKSRYPRDWKKRTNIKEKRRDEWMRV